MQALLQLSNEHHKFTDETGIPIHPQMIPIGHPNRPGRALTRFQAIGIHYTANENPGATDTVNAKYFGRNYFDPFIPNQDPFEEDKKTPFRFGSTQLLFDNDSGTLAMPLNEVSWATGDRAMPFDDAYRGQQPIAKKVFANSQNYRTLNIEICNNDIIKNSDEDWNMSVSNVKKFIKWLIKSLSPYGLRVNTDASLNPQKIPGPLPEGEILILRHYDMTGKMCPKPFVDDVKAWCDFVQEISS
jgi:N-acetylmuramoyl-L-alanine amidase CwlA